MGRLKGDALTQYGLWLDYLDALEAVDYIGPVHAGFVTVAPSTPHDVWHGVAWVTDTAAQHAADVAAAEQKKSALRAATDAEIAWLVVPIIGVEPTTFALRISRITFN